MSVPVRLVMMKVPAHDSDGDDDRAGDGGKDKNGGDNNFDGIDEAADDVSMP